LTEDDAGAGECLAAVRADEGGFRVDLGAGLDWHHGEADQAKDKGSGESADQGVLHGAILHSRTFRHGGFRSRPRFPEWRCFPGAGGGGCLHKHKLAVYEAKTA
jgi:hypothetical protein